MLILLVIPINFFIWKFFTKSTIVDFFNKEVVSRPDENISDIVAAQLYDRCKNQKFLRLLILIAGTFIIPIMIFFSNHIFYEDGPGGKYVRFFTEGVFSKSDIVIPNEIDGQKVVGIRGDVFRNTSIVNVILSENIDTIRGHAFEDCEKLESINLPEKLKYIGGYAFANCKNLNTKLPQSVSYIGGYAFSHCENAQLEVSENIDSIGGYAFEYCVNLRKVTLNKNIPEICGGTFSYTSIEEIFIPESVTRIGGSAFEGCSNLTKLEFALNSNVTRIGGHAFEYCALSEVYIPPSVSEIGSSAFRSCYNLVNVSVSKDCKINERAFKNSSRVKLTRY